MPKPNLVKQLAKELLGSEDGLTIVKDLLARETKVALGQQSAARLRVLFRIEEALEKVQKEKANG